MAYRINVDSSGINDRSCALPAVPALTSRWQMIRPGKTADVDAMLIARHLLIIIIIPS